MTKDGAGSKRATVRDESEASCRSANFGQ